MTSHADSARPVTLPYIPELFADNVLHLVTPEAPKPATKPAAATAPFMTAIQSVSNRALTQNEAAGYASTLSSTLDAFVGLTQATNHDDFNSLLTKSWDQDPLLTVKLIWNLRSIHDGKSARESFYR